MYSLEGAGLAAPQVGIDARLFVTAWGEVFIDPIIDCGADYTDVEEGCLSLPGVVVKKRRLLRIQLLDGRTYINEQAIVIQHEIDHLKGILIND
jgi:peptide deformylase